MHPTRADLKTVLASIGTRCYGDDQFQMFAGLHIVSLQLSESQDNWTIKAAAGPLKRTANFRKNYLVSDRNTGD